MQTGCLASSSALNLRLVCQKTKMTAVVIFPVADINDHCCSYIIFPFDENKFG